MRCWPWVGDNPRESMSELARLGARLIIQRAVEDEFDAWRICDELRERFEQCKRRSLYDTHVVALFLDATFISVRPSGPKEGCWRLGIHRRRRAGAVVGDAGDARVLRGLAGARTRSDR